jgi:hypothetical protein
VRPTLIEILHKIIKKIRNCSGILEDFRLSVSCLAVCVAMCGCPTISAAVCGSVQQCARLCATVQQCVRHCARHCVAMRAAVCGYVAVPAAMYSSSLVLGFRVLGF